MRRITISLPDNVGSALEREARRRSIPVSQIARDALTAHLRITPEGERRVLPFAALGHNSEAIPASELDQFLAEEWVDPTGNS
jgi:hypothetical protein